MPGALAGWMYGQPENMPELEVLCAVSSCCGAQPLEGWGPDQYILNS